jgi:hypothetical protein
MPLEGEIAMRIVKSLMPVLAVALVLLFASDALACPGCKEALADQQGVDAAGVRNGYFWSILFMIGTPFSLISAGAVAVARAVKRGALPEL